MVGIVVVSHSRPLARAAVALAAQMVPDAAVRIEIAAGIDEDTLGTDALAIAEAVSRADDGSGVVVLMDLGSAILSAETALEFLDDGQRARTVLCPAPLVEGLVAAAVVAAGGADRQTVAAEALNGLAGKNSHLGPPSTDLPATTTDAVSTGIFVVTNTHGLHARPAAKLVTQVRGYDARVDVRNVNTDSAWVSASSLSRVATLDARHGHQVEVRAGGRQAKAAVEEILALAARSFDETTAPTPALSAPESVTPLPTSPGIGIGPAWRADSGPVQVPESGVSGGPDAEWESLSAALATVRHELAHIRVHTGSNAGEDAAAIFDAHRLLLDDAELLENVRSQIANGRSAARSWLASISQVAHEFDGLRDPYLRARAVDVRAVGDHVLRALPAVAAQSGSGAGVVVGSDITPVQAAQLDPDRVDAVILAFGSPTSHSAIIIRALGIPAVVGLGPAVLEIPTGTTIAVDGTTGEVAVAPDENRLADFRRRRAAAESRATSRSGAATTRDGIEIAVAANVGSVEDARQAACFGADLIGLVRTELLFLGHSTAPDVDEQEAVYRAIAAAADGRRVTLRTLDVGGDKPLGFLPAPTDVNPFLGLRGVRYALAHPAILRDQLIATVRVAHDFPVGVMFPMVTGAAEIRGARELLDEAIALVGRGRPVGFEVGIMVEVPTTALKAAALAHFVDFFSIGTNDLTQYATAAERGNPAVAGIADGFDPGVLALIASVGTGAAAQARVGVCGEIAADPAATALLYGLGVQEFSVAPRSVPVIKDAISATETVDACRVAADALAAEDAAAVRALL